MTPDFIKAEALVAIAETVRQFVDGLRDIQWGKFYDIAEAERDSRIAVARLEWAIGHVRIGEVTKPLFSRESLVTVAGMFDETEQDNG